MAWEDLLREIVSDEDGGIHVDDPVILLIPERLLGPIMRVIEDREEEAYVTAFFPVAPNA